LQPGRSDHYHERIWCKAGYAAKNEREGNTVVDQLRGSIPRLNWAPSIHYIRCSTRCASVRNSVFSFLTMRGHGVAMHGGVFEAQAIGIRSQPLLEPRAMAFLFIREPGDVRMGMFFSMVLE
jgi:hypothetical protein